MQCNIKCYTLYYIIYYTGIIDHATDCININDYSSNSWTILLIIENNITIAIYFVFKKKI